MLAPVSNSTLIYIYDEVKYGGAPTIVQAKQLLNDIQAGRAMPDFHLEPGWKERLIAISNGDKVDDSYFCSLTI